MLSDQLKLEVIQALGFKEVSFSSMNQGSLNQNYLLNAGTDLKKYIVRVNNTTTPGVYRESEYELLRTLEHLNLSAKLIHNEQHFAIFEFVEGHSIDFDQLQKSEVKSLITSLKLIHNTQLSLAIPNLWTRLIEYQSLAQSALLKCEKRKLEGVIISLKKVGFFESNQLIHSDLNPKNLLWGKSLKIIDWEFAGRGHPVFDLAVLEHYNLGSFMSFKSFYEYLNSFENGLQIFKLCLELLPVLIKLWEAAEQATSN